jgi:hypothetical protein
MSGLIDLDELILKCRDEKARVYIAEAVGCYRAGSYRSSIVASWIAVVFDILGKFNELELAGDKNAAAHLKKFEEIRAGGEGRLVDALAFEREILSLAEREFELLTPIEKEELARLQADRNKCAHPSMQSQIEPYQPTAETARAHLRNAVDIMLGREPVQGKAALSRLFDEVKSEYFPDTIDEALTHFRRGPLTRAKDSLIRNFMVGITKAYFFENKPSLERRRMRAAIGAVIEMHRDRAEKVVADDLVELIRPMPDDQLWMIIAFSCKLPAVWRALGPAIQGKVKAYVANAQDKDPMLRPAAGAALDMPDLRDEAVKRIGKMSASDFAAVVADHPEEIFCDRAVKTFQNVNGFRWAEEYCRTVILPLAKSMTPIHITAVTEAVKANGQIHAAGGTQEILCEFFDRVADRIDGNKKDWQGMLTHLLELDSRGALGVSHKYADLQLKMEKAGAWPAHAGEAQ